MTLVRALALLASVVFLIRLLPQPVRLARRGSADGLSPLAALNALVSAVAWAAYGVAAHLPVVWTVSVLAVVPCAWQVALLRGHTTRTDLLWAAAFAGAVVAAAVVGHLGFVLGATVLVTTGPQVRAALVSSDLSGVAPATWRIAVIDAITWGLYGLAIRDGALIGYFVTLLVASLVVLARISWAERAAAAALAFPPAAAT